MRALAITLGLMLVAAPAFAGPNPNATLAMHTVASFDYLYCPELNGMLFDCTMIDNSAEMAELDASYGYVYVLFLAYDVECISGVEYCIGGWPASRGAPPVPPLNYCPESSLILGDPFAGGGVQAFGECVCTDVCDGTIGFAWFVWGAYAYTTVLPLTLDYCASGYSYPTDPHNYVLACADFNFEEDVTVAEFGCTIGGVYPILVPYDGCDPGATAVDPTSWSNVKAMYK
jgi:hypothetical protein